MMRKRQIRHNNVNLMVNTTSSDPTSKGASAGPSHRVPPASVHAPVESLAVGIETPQNGGQRPRGPFGPIYHKARRGNKLTDWQFIGKTSIWFLGDSNLNRVPAFHNSDIQIDSFPGLEQDSGSPTCQSTGAVGGGQQQRSGSPMPLFTYLY